MSVKLWMAPMWLIVLAVVFYPRTVEQVAPIGSNTTSLLYLWCTALALAGMWLARKSPVRLRYALAPFGALLLPIFSGIFSGTLYESLVVTAEKPLLMAASVASYAILAARKDLYEVERLFRALPWIGVACVGVAVAQAFGGSWGWYDDFAVQASSTSLAFPGRQGATFGHPSIFGVFLALGITFAIRYRVKWWLVAVAISVIGIALSGSRVAAVTALVGGALALVASSRHRKWEFPSSSVAGVLLASAATVAFAPMYWSGFFTKITDATEGRFSNIGQDTSYIAHVARQDAALDLIRADFATLVSGNGPAAAARYLGSNHIGDRQAATFDNAYLTTAIDYGVIGLLLIVAGAVVILWRNPFHIPAFSVFAIAALSYDFDQWAPLLVFPALILGVSAGMKRGDSGSGVGVVEERIPSAESAAH